MVEAHLPLLGKYFREHVSPSGECAGGRDVRFFQPLPVDLPALIAGPSQPLFFHTGPYNEPPNIVKGLEGFIEPRPPLRNVGRQSTSRLLACWLCTTFSPKARQPRKFWSAAAYRGSLSSEETKPTGRGSLHGDVLRPRKRPLRRTAAPFPGLGRNPAHPRGGRGEPPWRQTSRCSPDPACMGQPYFEQKRRCYWSNFVGGWLGFFTPKPFVFPQLFLFLGGFSMKRLVTLGLEVGVGWVGFGATGPRGFPGRFWVGACVGLPSRDPGG